MRDALHLAWRYLRHHRVESLVLVTSLAVVLALPASLHRLVRGAAEDLTARSRDVPLLVGSPGSATDLVLSALYLEEPDFAPVPARVAEEVRASGRARAVPLHLRFQARGHRIVGTDVDYLALRGLTLVAGRPFALLGECVLGATAARELGAGVGDAVLSSPAGAFDAAGAFPLRMHVVGVLAPRGAVEDRAVLVGVETAWVIEGLAHGHEDLTRPGREQGVLSREEGRVVAAPSVLSYLEVTEANRASFHFHGDPGEFPLDAVLVLPHGRRDGVLLRGELQGRADRLQVVEPRQVVDELLETVFAVRDHVVLAGIGVGLATVATVGLVFVLSIRLRRRELETLRRIGATRERVAAILAAEIGLVVGAAMLVAAALVGVAGEFSGLLLRVLTG